MRSVQDDGLGAKGENTLCKKGKAPHNHLCHKDGQICCREGQAQGMKVDKLDFLQANASLAM